MVERSAIRVVPKSAITVAIEEEGAVRAYGVVANISEAGACVWTDATLDVGQDLMFALSFPHEPQPLETRGRVVWAGPTPTEGTVRYGLQWSSPTRAERARLKELIGSA